MQTIVEFTEEMKGFAALGETDCEHGEQSGQPLMVHLKIRTENIDFFEADPAHRGTAEGYVRYDALRGGNLSVEKGEFQCLVDEVGNSREIRYHLFFYGETGAPLTLSGMKLIRHDGIQNVWRDCSTLFVKIFASHIDAEEEQSATAIAAGIIRIQPLDFVHELTTFRGKGPSFLKELEAVERFGRFFIGALWDVYKPKVGSIRSHGKQRHISVFTLEGVRNADVSTHHFSTADRLGLSMLRFTRGECNDAVVLLHGLTTSTDMFIMPEHYNIINYLLDYGFTDVWSFDWRGSMRYSYDLFPSDFTMDDIALYDMPAAFSKLRQIIGPDKRIHVICHCVGSMTFMMSLYARQISGITSVISNSVSLNPRISGWSRLKLSVAPLVFFRATALNPRWSYSPGLFDYGKWLSKGISQLHPECGTAACHMVSFMWGKGRPAAWMHDNLDEVTHNRTGDLFGAVNINYYRHIRKMAGRQTAVKMYPDDPKYGTLPNDYLDHANEVETPILFVTGQLNRIFLDSNVRTYQILNKLKPGNKNKCKIFDGYGHQDVFMGKNCFQDVFPVFLKFLQSHSSRSSSH